MRNGSRTVKGASNAAAKAGAATQSKSSEPAAIEPCRAFGAWRRDLDVLLVVNVEANIGRPRYRRHRQSLHSRVGQFLPGTTAPTA